MYILSTRTYKHFLAKHNFGENYTSLLFLSHPPPQKKTPMTPVHHLRLPLPIPPAPPPLPPATLWFGGCDPDPDGILVSCQQAESRLIMAPSSQSPGPASHGGQVAPPPTPHPLSCSLIPSLGIPAVLFSANNYVYKHAFQY
jgi:hypothetical protein